MKTVLPPQRSGTKGPQDPPPSSDPGPAVATAPEDDASTSWRRSYLWLPEVYPSAILGQVLEDTCETAAEGKAADMCVWGVCVCVCVCVCV